MIGILVLKFYIMFGLVFALSILYGFEKYVKENKDLADFVAEVKASHLRYLVFIVMLTLGWLPLLIQALISMSKKDGL